MQSSTKLSISTPSFVIGKHPCPKCRTSGRDRKGDNLAEYSDGHLYCFACGYFKHGSIEKRIQQYDAQPRNESIALPEDVDLCTNGEGYIWLASYGITMPEIIQHRIMWSERTRLLVYPYFEGRELTGWQARNFNKDKSYKYITKGMKDKHFLFGNSDTICLVEDIVSAIKVGRSITSTPILGSVIQLKTFIRLSRNYSTIIVWLDPDKQKEAINFASKARSIGIDVRTILQYKDPKDYNDTEIKETIESIR